MNPQPLNVPALLRQHGLTPHKGLGQNFLVEPSFIHKLVKAAEIDPAATVLEIGPGAGSLTLELAQAARRVVAVELDTNLMPLLKSVLAGCPNVTLVQADVLDLDPAELIAEEGYLVVANIPYYITSAILRHLLSHSPRPTRMVLTMQREVAERICAAPGKMSLLALSVQVYGAPRPALHIPAGAFYPAPTVDSTSLRIDLSPQPRIPVDDLPAFFDLIKAGFAQKRKTLRNTLSAGLHLAPQQAADLLTAAGIDPQRRAETLNLEEWGQLTRVYKTKK